MSTYAAVASLLQTLDYVVKLPCLIFEIMEIRREALKPKLDELLKVLTRDPSTVSSSHLRHSIDETSWLLNCPVDDFTYARFYDATETLAIKQRLLLSLTSLTTTKFVEDGEWQMLKDIKFFEENLGKFLHSIAQDILLCRPNSFLYLHSHVDPELLKLSNYVREQSCPSSIPETNVYLQELILTVQHSNGTISTPDLQLQFSQVVSNGSLPPIVAAIETLWKTSRMLRNYVTGLYEATMQITVRHQNLLFLLTFLKEDSSNKCCHDNEFLERIKDVDRARVLVEERMVDNQIESAMTDFFCSLDRISLPMPYRTHIVRTVGSFCFGKDISYYLEQASKEIQSIKVTTGKINDRSPSSQISTSSFSRHHSNKDDIVVGLDAKLNSLLEGLTTIPSGLEIVTILGMGGIGKTTLARKAFHHPYTAYHFHCRAWITVSQAYQVRDLFLGLLGSLAQSTDKMIDKNNAQLAEVVYRSLKGQRYLIVMDDVWSIDVWNDVRRCFPDDKNGSRIVLTSRIKKLADYINPNKPSHCMSLLDTEQSWELLQKLVFRISSCPPELVKFGKHIAKRCQGLPLAIVVIAGVLSRIMTYDYWNDIAEQVSSIVSTNPEECLDILALSYNYLPHHLKACFLYMAAFPEDCAIEVQKLINLWVAEGFLGPQSSKNLEQIAEEYLEDLIGRNLVFIDKRCFGGNVKTCRLHDFLRELCLREAHKENFMHVIQKRGAKHFPVRLRYQRRLSFHLDPYGDVLAAPAIPHVSSFLCFALGAGIVPDLLFFQLGFKLLRVLDIFFLHLDYFPVQILELIHLRYLALKVTYELPASISQLRNLQTLVIHGPWHCRQSSSSPTLLMEYLSMPSLRHLHCSVTFHLENPPRDVRVLSRCLRTLSTIRFSSCTEEVFSIMPHLMKLKICERDEDYNKDASAEFLRNLHCLRELETLTCCFYEESRKSRHISCLSALPCTLRRLSLSWSYLPWENMTSIAMMPRLEVLKLKNFAFQGPKWEPTEEGFRSLKHLLIENTDLAHWEATVHHFPRLQHLVLKSCKLLEEIPFFVDEIGALQRLELHYCGKSAEAFAREIQDQIIQDQIEGIEVVISSER